MTEKQKQEIIEQNLRKLRVKVKALEAELFDMGAPTEKICAACWYFQETAIVELFEQVELVSMLKANNLEET